MKMSITNVEISEKWIYDTYKGGLIITTEINKKPVKFHFSPIGGTFDFIGMDSNEAEINGKNITITKNGLGGFKHYEFTIPVEVLKSKPKANQKDFRFTGRYYSTKPIVPFLKKKLKEMLAHDKFSELFLNEIR